MTNESSGALPPPDPTLICPACRKPPFEALIDAATLTCTNPDCLIHFPRFGPDIPILFDGTNGPVEKADLLGDLEPVATLPERVGRLANEPSAWEEVFRNSMYVCSHWTTEPNLMAELCERLLPLVDIEIQRAVDLGCGPGRMAVEVAHRTGATVVGIDASPLALRWAERASRGSTFFTPVRRRPGSFDLEAIAPPVSPAPGRVLWLCSDVLHPPFEAESFDLVVAVNLLDSVRDPWIALGQASALLREGGYFLMAQPDAWMHEIAPRTSWLGTTSLSWDKYLARVGLQTIERIDDLSWTLERSERMRFDYTLHGRLARRVPWPK